MRKTFLYLLLLAQTLFLFQCANEGSPTGGPRDEAPPVFIKSTPLPNSLNFDGKRVTVTFDENIVLKDLFTHFVASPPLQEDPDVKAIGNVLRVDLNNELQPNTTYTLYFGESVVDNNEGNPYENFTFSFSTGDDIDSLMMSGIILDAKTLDPIKSQYVSLYTNFEDSAVLTTVPVRIAKTNSEGIFTVRNLPDTLFHIFGLNDLDKDYKYSPGGEDLAFLEKELRPYWDTVQKMDTIWADSLTVDTILFSDTIVYYPDDIILFMFKEDRYFQNLKKKKRVSRQLIEFEFATPMLELPKIALLDTLMDNWYLYEPSITRDSLAVWITDSTLFKKDTINVTFEYQVSDSLQNVVWKTDTLYLSFKEKVKKSTKSKRKKNRDEGEETEQIEMLTFSSNFSSRFDVYKSIYLVFNEPIDTFRPDFIHLFEVVDSIETKLNATFVQDTAVPRRFFLHYPWNEEMKYKFIADSMAFVSIYGKYTDNVKTEFSIKGKDQFGDIFVSLSNVSGKGFVELIDGKDESLKSSAFSEKNSKVHFEYLSAGTYYIRLFVDANDNGKWDTGSYLEKRQPEQVFYYHKKLEVKQNWTLEEEWDILEVPIYEQKPKGLKKDDKK